MPRNALIFKLAIDADLSGVPVIPEPLKSLSLTNALWSEPLNDLRIRALQVSSMKVASEERIRNVYQRNEAVKIYVLRRSRGICEGCEQPAPFKRLDGRYYLEAHHIRRISDFGPDHPRWVAALCPNCHRRVHSGDDQVSFNQRIADRIGKLES
jgi:5-methylcytosine-specific restriction protein A